MHLSRPRVVLRVVLLAIGGAFMLWRALEGRRALETLQGPDAELASWLTLIWALMGLLALVTAATAALSLRPRRRRTTLQLDGARRARSWAGDAAPPAPGPPPDEPRT